MAPRGTSLKAGKQAKAKAKVLRSKQPEKKMQTSKPADKKTKLVEAGGSSDPNMMQMQKRAGSSADSAMMQKRQEAGERLDKKVEEFKHKVKKMGDATGEAAKLSLLKSHFEPGEMGALWGRLKAARKKEDMTISEAWSTICSLPSGVAVAKNKVLLDLICKPPGSWASNLLKHQEVVKRVEKGEIKKTEYTRGELEVLHGQQEAEELINKGKFVRAIDDDGDEVFTKKTRSHVSQAERTQEMQFERTRIQNKLLKTKTHMN